MRAQVPDLASADFAFSLSPLAIHESPFLLHHSGDFLIDFMPGLAVPLLGVANFLSGFVLTVDYPRKRFSLKQR